MMGSFDKQLDLRLFFLVATLKVNFIDLLIEVEAMK